MLALGRAVSSSATAKTRCILDRSAHEILLKHEQFVSKYISTIGVDYGVKGIVLAGEEVKVNFWDLAGSKEYLEVRNEFYKDTQGCLLVCDIPIISLPLFLPAANFSCAARFLMYRARSRSTAWRRG